MGTRTLICGDLSEIASSFDAMTAVAPSPDFVAQADPYRREILAHCYRMMGSVHDAEDLVQETYLRAWRGFDKFEGKASLRTWLHKIATRTCLTALESKKRRELPTDLAGPNPTGELVEPDDVPWLEPLPDAVTSPNADPAEVATSHESTRLALIAALQHLPARQRAVLLLRDVLRWRAAEVSELLDVSVPAVNSMLQRARSTLDKAQLTQEDVAEPSDAQIADTLAKWVAAFERYDMDELVRLMHAETVWEMPPKLNWARGAGDIIALIKKNCPKQYAGAFRFVPTSANGRPALGMYMLDDDGTHRPFSVQVLDIGAGGVGHIVQFFDTSLFGFFGLPDVLEST